DGSRDGLDRGEGGRVARPRPLRPLPRGEPRGPEGHLPLLRGRGVTRRVVVTGLGVVTPLGTELEAVWQAWLAGRPARAVPYLDAAGAFDAKAFAQGMARIHPGSLLRNAADRPATETARRLGLLGPVYAVTTACAASAQAVGTSLRAIRSGKADVMLAGGAD